jgi:hypothetical protein
MQPYGQYIHNSMRLVRGPLCTGSVQILWQLCYSVQGLGLVVKGWSEPAATNAPVEDEAVEAVLGMNQKHILPCPKFLVFSAASLSQSFSLLPTSLPPTSPLLPLTYFAPPTYLT